MAERQGPTGEAGIRATKTTVVTLPERAGEVQKGRGLTPLDLALSAHELNDIGNAERFIARHGDDLLFVREVGWHVWSGRHWAREGAAEEVRKRAHLTAREIACEAQAAYQEGYRLKDQAGELGRPRDEAQQLQEKSLDLTSLGERLLRWCVETGDRGRIGAMIAEAQAYLAIEPAAMDADRFALNLANGFLPLVGACEDLAAHAREQLAAKLVPVAYDPAATAPRFSQFLAEVQPNPQVRSFLQAWAGYLLTGSTAEQKVVFFHGEGANGKSVFVNLMAKILGPYAGTMPFSSLVLDERKRGGEPTPDLARLLGIRYVRASESERGMKLAEATLKSITGGEAIPVRFLNREFFDLVPQFKMILSGQHKPRVLGTDHGIWRRLLLVPWAVTIPEARQVDDLDEVLFCDEAPGILNWCLDGCRRWLEEGLQVPEVIAGATSQYRSDSDPLGRFLGDCVEVDPVGSVAASELFAVYREWCHAHEEREWSQTAFGRGLIEKGLERQDGRIRRYLKIRLIETELDDEPPGAPPDYGG